MLLQASAVAIAGRALLITGKPGSGKSSLALALIDRGASLIGDDGVSLSLREDGSLLASPPPNIAGMLELRGVGIVTLETAEAPVALLLDLDASPERLPESIATREFLGQAVPAIALDGGSAHAALRAEWALRLHGAA